MCAEMIMSYLVKTQDTMFTTSYFLQNGDSSEMAFKFKRIEFRSTEDIKWRSKTVMVAMAAGMENIYIFL